MGPKKSATGTARQPSMPNLSNQSRSNHQRSFQSNTRTQFATPVSPTGSVASAATNRGRANSPSLKRKERDFEARDEGSSETNITVVVRCRGRNQREIAENSGVVLSTPGGLRGKEVMLSMGTNALNNKTYTFDRVFPPEADQAMVYDDVVNPILNEVYTPSSLDVIFTQYHVDALWVQLHNFCIWANWNRQDVYHVW